MYCTVYSKDMGKVRCTEKCAVKCTVHWNWIIFFFYNLLNKLKFFSGIATSLGFFVKCSAKYLSVVYGRVYTIVFNNVYFLVLSTIYIRHGEGW